MLFNKYKERYIVEHEAVPEILYADDDIKKTQDILKLIENGREAMMLVIYKTIYDESGSKCPYSKEQFNVCINTKTLPGLTKYRIVLIDLPKPETVPLCSKMIICYCENYEYIRYYTVEKSIGINKYVLCEWGENGVHINYGDAPTDTNELQNRIKTIYSNYLKKTYIKDNNVDSLRLKFLCDSFRTFSYLISDSLSECHILHNEDLLDHLLDHVALLMLELTTIQLRGERHLSDALCEQLLPLTGDSLNQTEKNRIMDIYRDIYDGKAEPRAFWLKTPEKARLDSKTELVIAAFGDLLLFPECHNMYFTCKRPLLSNEGREEFRDILMNDVKEHIENYLRSVISRM